MADGAATISEIEEKLSELKVVSMLNGKYIIVAPDAAPVYTRYAYGNCWFVDDFVPAATPDEEIALLAATDLHTTAVIGEDFAWAQRLDSPDVSSPTPIEDLRLTHYAPNEIRYTFSTDRERAAIFSEIYYPEGWKAWIEPAGTYGTVRGGHYIPTENAKQIELFRANWMLRGAILPKGEGTLVMRFEPESYQVGENISRACSISLIILLILAICGIIIPQVRAKH